MQPHGWQRYPYRKAEQIVALRALYYVCDNQHQYPLLVSDCLLSAYHHVEVHYPGTFMVSSECY